MGSIYCFIAILMAGLFLVDAFSSPMDTPQHPSSSSSSSSSSFSAPPSTRGEYSFVADKYSTVGQDIPTIQTWAQAWEVASRFWIPTDEYLLPPHLVSQMVHQEKRQRWASQFLLKLSTLTTNPNLDMDDIFSDCDGDRIQFDRNALTRVLQAAAMYPNGNDDTMTSSSTPRTDDRVEKEGAWILDSLTGIHGLVGRWNLKLDLEAGAAVQLLMDRASQLNYPQLDQACRALWVIKGLGARVEGVTLPPRILVEDRVQSLPFQIIPRGVEWSKVQPKEDGHYEDVCKTLIRVIPFQNDVIVTRFGDKVQERRGTAWIAKQGIGALAYSGKLMPPQPLPELVQHVMRTVEHRLDLPPQFFDCALCNHYADSTAACKFHTDPEHGTMWDRTTVVVAAGSDRIFAFKPITTTWKAWDVDQDTTTVASSSGGGDKTAATIHLFSGDLVVMRDNCNDDFYHAVYAGISDEPRVSLVLKRSVGRGHGLPGQGKRRRSKERITSPDLPSASTKRQAPKTNQGRNKATTTSRRRK